MKRLAITLTQAILASILLTSGAWAAKLPTLTPADYDSFENLGRKAEISHDGRWVAYTVTRVDRDRTLHIRDLETDTALTFEWGEEPTFAETSLYVGWTVGLSDENKKELEQEDKKAYESVALLSLGETNPQILEKKQSFAFDATGRYVAVLGYALEEPEGKGADLRILDLDGESEITLGNVAEYTWSDNKSLLALVIATGNDEGNSIQVYDAANGQLRGLDTSESRYHSPSWREESTDLAVFRTLAASSDEESKAVVTLAWSQLNSDDEQRHELPHDAGPDAHQTVGSTTPDWSDDGRRLSIGLRPCDTEDGCEKGKEEAEVSKDDQSEQVDSSESKKQEKEPEDPENEDEEPELPEMQIWHAKDLRLFPEQQKSSKRDEKRTLLAVWHLESNKLVPIGTDLQAQTELLGNWDYATETTAEPYPWGEMFGRPYEDVWLVDTTTGQRTKVLEKVRWSSSSAEGHYLLHFDGKDFIVYDRESGELRNLTEGIDSTFADLEYDTPTDLLPDYGTGGWTEGDQSVLLYDRFDVWQVPMDGGLPQRITAGADDHLIHRVLDLDPEEEAIQSARGIYFGLRNEDTEQRGFARRLPDQSETELLTLGDSLYSRLLKAKESETFVYRNESRTDSPDLFAVGYDFSDPAQISKTNQQQEKFAWTRSELVNFVSEEGRDLQAALLYPANYDKKTSYPMIVYTYELLAPQIHRYEAPDQRDYYNFTAWTQEGYFVLLPDIVYTAREPGPSALASVRAAVQTIVDRGLVDSKKVGLIGHSWGGYQATYLPTRTNIFAASVAGAPLTDFVSFMGQLHWNPGQAELSHWETGQARMEVPFWEDPDAHRRSSPIHKVHEMETPLLMAFGNEDGVVDWDQGTEFFNFARRAEKQMVLLVYEGEDHGFRGEANQRDYHRRILEWFGHYLKGDPMPEWIRAGIRFEDLEEEKKRLHGTESEPKDPN